MLHTFSNIAATTIQSDETSDSETSLIPNSTIAPIGAKSDGLSPGAVAGLIVGFLSLVLVVAITVVIVALILMKHKQTKGKYSTNKEHALGIRVMHKNEI